MGKYTAIDDPSAHFQATTYTGTNSSGNSITNSGNSNLQPDMVWIKVRTYDNPHIIQDTSRGFAGNGEVNLLIPNTTDAEGTNGAFESFDSNGFTVGGTNPTSRAYNGSSDSYIAWQWKVNGGTTTSLSSNINSVCQVNQAAGISIVKYTCTGGGNGQSVQHGLGLVPQVIITKNRTDTSYSKWITYHHSLGYTNFVKLNETAASAGSSPYNGAEPTSSTYNVSIDLVEAPKDYVSYVFAPIQGYSKFGKYVGNGNTNGTFVYTGFKPAFVLVKNASAVESWVVYDTARNTFNLTNLKLSPDTADRENNNSGIGGAGYNDIDILSNGFKCRSNNAATNGNGNTIIYMAWAENPFVTSTGTPTTAR